MSAEPFRKSLVIRPYAEDNEVRTQVYEMLTMVGAPIDTESNIPSGTGDNRALEFFNERYDGHVIVSPQNPHKDGFGKIITGSKFIKLLANKDVFSDPNSLVSIAPIIIPVEEQSLSLLNTVLSGIEINHPQVRERIIVIGPEELGQIEKTKEKILKVLMECRRVKAG